MTNDFPPNPTVLVVEDEPLLQRVFVETLENHGFGVEVADCGDSAWRLVQGGVAFDILLTDVRMPGCLDGLDLARKVKATAQHTPIIVMSGFIGSGAMESGLGIFLAKPFTSDALVSAVEQITKRR